MEASNRLEVHEKTLATHLAKTTFVDEEGNSIPLSYKLLKTRWPTEAEAEQALGMLYKQVINTQAIPLAQRTMRTIHQTICNSKSLLGAATSLGVYSSSLERYLSFTDYSDDHGRLQPLTYKAMKSLWPTEIDAAQFWGMRYDQPMKDCGLELKNRTMRYIHRAILDSSSLHNAGSRLGVSVNTLKAHLGQTLYIDKLGESYPLTYQIMKEWWPSETEAERVWGSPYDEVMVSNYLPIEQRTMKEIHSAILNSSSLQAAANRLGVVTKTLSIHLAKTSYVNSQGQIHSLSYEVLKAWDAQTMAEAWGSRYDEVMNSTRVAIKDRTIREVYRAIINNSTRSTAACNLGIHISTFDNYLAKTSFVDSQGRSHALTYEVMKGWCTEAVAEQILGDGYDKAPHLDKVKKRISSHGLWRMSKPSIMQTAVQDIDAEPPCKRIYYASFTKTEAYIGTKQYCFSEEPSEIDEETLSLLQRINTDEDDLEYGDPGTYQIQSPNTPNQGSQYNRQRFFSEGRDHHEDHELHEFITYSCYARSILSCHIFKLLPSNLVRSKNQFVLNSKVI
ncbi:hypothetical protein [Legionella sp. km772]|uniref:hypothetical protein n=1 Tax=Legionella sp. km772 TaxID=2498111 RepID=UPI000FBBD2DD|nr:hypothetical protein [Legionella sp. km772]RUR04499.1 hypothetical protein ELY15_15430 [Legionella sp. km772]